MLYTINVKSALVKTKDNFVKVVEKVAEYEYEGKFKVGDRFEDK